MAQTREADFKQLAIHTTGGVVISAQRLMIVVPDSPTVTAEVKLGTFPYTKYGTVKARMSVVTAKKKGYYTRPPCPWQSKTC